MFRSLSRSLLWRGLLSIAIGIVAIIWPGITIASVVIIFAVAVFLDAFYQGARAFSSNKAGPVAEVFGLFSLGYGMWSLVLAAGPIRPDRRLIRSSDRTDRTPDPSGSPTDLGPQSLTKGYIS
jgi:hypothetical protein